MKEEPPDARGAEGIEEQVQDEIQREARRGGESGLPVEVVEDPRDLSTAGDQGCDEGDDPVSPPAGGLGRGGLAGDDERRRADRCWRR